MSAPPTLEDVRRARERVRPFADRTPVRSIPLSGKRLLMKCEHLQPTGSFKVRGAANRILTAGPEALERGVVTFSTGNHGRAVAEVARRLGIPCHICVSDLVPAFKREMFVGSGATLVVHGRDQDEAARNAFELRDRDGLCLVHPFDDPAVIAGQGTLALELIEQAPEVRTVLVPVGGGGLISGVAMALKFLDPQLRVVGVQMTRNPVMHHSQEVGRPVELEELETVADSLAGGIFLDNRYTFAMVRDLVDQIVLVSEDEIHAAMRFAATELDTVLEGAGAVGLAAVLSGRVDAGSDLAAVIASGGNVAAAEVRL